MNLKTPDVVLASQLLGTFGFNIRLFMYSVSNYLTSIKVKGVICGIRVAKVILMKCQKISISLTKDGSS